jgi:uncharacterized protein with FMN-binding domain
VRRTALTIVATIVGLVLLLQFKTHPASQSSGGLASLGTLPTRSHDAHAAQKHLPVRPAPTARRSSRPSFAPTTPAASRMITATGQTAHTRYGPVQVRIVETAGRLTDVTAIQVPTDNSHSREIAANAVPTLRAEALRANSAHIDVVSGATYTSDGYAQSLQSALDNA